MFTPEQLAIWANQKASQQGPYQIPEEKLFVMLEAIRQTHYHLIAPDIQEACRKQVGLAS